MGTFDSFKFYVATEIEGSFVIEKYTQAELEALLYRHITCNESDKEIGVAKWVEILSHGGLFDDGYGAKIRIVGNSIMSGIYR